MWNRMMFARLMAEAGQEGGGGGGGETTAAGVETGDGASAGGAVTAKATAQPASILAKAEGGENQPLPPSEFIPEKYRVMGEGGVLDLEASARKVAEAHSHLEKRMGSGDLPPKEVGDYTITTPESMKNYNPGEDADVQAFLQKAHGAGMTQAQIDVVMGSWFEAAQKIAGGSVTLDQQKATEVLQQSWGTDQREFDRHAGLANLATRAAASTAKIGMEEIEQAGLGNNPVFLRLMAALGPEFQEEKGAGQTSIEHFGDEEVEALMASEAYRDVRHRDHQRVNEKVTAYFKRKHGDAPVG